MKKAFNFDANDLPLEGDSTTRYLPWFFGIMVYLLVLSMTIFMLMQQAAHYWQNTLTGKVTIQVSPLNDTRAASADVRARDVLLIVKNYQSVINAEILDAQKVQLLLKPWLGDHLSELDIPLPVLITAELKKGAAINPDKWAADISAKVPGVLVDDHNTWVRGLIRFAEGLQASSLIVLGVVMAATLLMIIYTTKMGLSVHGNVIDILHLIGAKDSYIAWQFQVHTFRISLKGVLYGLALGLMTVFAISLTGLGAESLLLPSVGLSFVDWACLIFTPLLVALIATIVARRTVISTLKEMV